MADQHQQEQAKRIADIKKDRMRLLKHEIFDAFIVAARELERILHNAETNGVNKHFFVAEIAKLGEIGQATAQIEHDLKEYFEKGEPAQGAQAQQTAAQGQPQRAGMSDAEKENYKKFLEGSAAVYIRAERWAARIQKVIFAEKKLLEHEKANIEIQLSRIELLEKLINNEEKGIADRFEKGIIPISAEMGKIMKALTAYLGALKKKAGELSESDQRAMADIENLAVQANNKEFAEMARAIRQRVTERLVQEVKKKIGIDYPAIFKAYGMWVSKKNSKIEEAKRIRDLSELKDSLRGFIGESKAIFENSILGRISQLIEEADKEMKQGDRERNAIAGMLNVLKQQITMLQQHNPPRQ